MKDGQFKKNIRCIGFDDVPFKRKNINTHIVGTLIRAPNYVEGFVYKNIKIDGLDATNKIIESLESKYKDQIKCIFTQGLTFGGFNIIDCKKIYENIKIPIISITKKIPDMSRVKSALEKHFNDWELRYELLNIPEKKIMNIKDGKIFVQYYGADFKDVEFLVNLFTLNGHIPEPLRISHMVATSLKFGYSKGI